MRARARRRWPAAAVLGLGAYSGLHLLCFGLTRSLEETVDLLPSPPLATPTGPPDRRTEAGGQGAAPPRAGRASTVLKVMSYNLNHVTRGNDNSPDNDPHFAGGMPEWAKIAVTLNCLVRDPGRVDRHLRQIVELIRSEDPDIVFLQEADRDAVESRRIDTASWIARASGYPYAIWGPKWSLDLGLARHVTGNAILSRYPIVEAQNVPLNDLTLLRRCLGMHAAVVAVVTVGGQRVRLVNTHLYSKKHRYEKKAAQVRRLLGLVRNSPEPVIWGGDLNCSFRRLHSRRPARNDPTLGLLCASGLARGSGFFDAATLDYILLRPGDTTRYHGLRRLPPVATDHHILVAQVELLPAALPASGAGGSATASWGAVVTRPTTPLPGTITQVDMIYDGPVRSSSVVPHTEPWPGLAPPAVKWSEVLALVWR